MFGSPTLLVLGGVFGFAGGGGGWFGGGLVHGGEGAAELCGARLLFELLDLLLEVVAFDGMRYGCCCIGVGDAAEQRGTDRRGKCDQDRGCRAMRLAAKRRNRVRRRRHG